jgi:hypothetical protein
MPTYIVNPETELHLVCTQGIVFEETDFEINLPDRTPVDLTDYRVECIVKESSGGSNVLLWDTDDSSITIEGVDTNIFRLGEKTVEQMSITAKIYTYEIYMTPPGGNRARKFYGRFIVNA